MRTCRIMHTCARTPRRIGNTYCTDNEPISPESGHPAQLSFPTTCTVFPLDLAVKIEAMTALPVGELPSIENLSEVLHGVLLDSTPVNEKKNCCVLLFIGTIAAATTVPVFTLQQAAEATLASDAPTSIIMADNISLIVFIVHILSTVVSTGIQVRGLNQSTNNTIQPSCLNCEI